MNRRQLGYLSWIAKVAIAGKADVYNWVFIRYEDYYVAVREHYMDAEGKPGFRNRTKVIAENFPDPVTVMETLHAVGLIRYRVEKLGIRDEWCYAEVDEQMCGFYYTPKHMNFALASAVIVLACDDKKYQLPHRYHQPEVKR